MSLLPPAPLSLTLAFPTPDHVMRYASLASDPNVSSAEVKLLHSDDEDSLLCLSDQDLEDLSL